MKLNNLEPFLEKIRRGEMPLGVVVTFADPWTLPVDGMVYYGL